MSIDISLAPANQLTYSTFLGGDGNDIVRGLDVHNGVFHACGSTNSSTGFPLSFVSNFCEADAFSFTYNGGYSDAFLTKLDPTNPNSHLRYSTYLGGIGEDDAYAIARLQDRVDLIVGSTASADFPVRDHSGGTPYDSTLGGARDAFITRFAWKPGRSSPLHLDYSTYFGGGSSGGNGNEDEARGLAMDGSLDLYFGGWTRASGFPTAGSPFDSTWNGGSVTGDGFASHFSLPVLTSP